MKDKTLYGYKETELGMIPEDWEVLSVKELGDISTSSVNKKSCPDEKEVNLVNYMDVYNNLHRVIDSKIEFMKVTAKDSQIENSNIKKGDVLFTPTSETREDIGISAVVTEDLPNTLFSYHLLRLRFNKEIDLNFKRYMFNNPLVLQQFSKIAQGATRFILTREDFLKVKLPLPSKDQQVKIASILQEVNSTIDETDRIINKVEKIKKGLMNTILVKGIDKEFIDTDIGKMPEGWRKIKLKAVLDVKNGKTDTVDAVEDGEFPLFDRSAVIKRSDKFLFDDEAIILPGEGKEFTPRYFKGKFDLHQRAYALTSKTNEINTKFMSYAIDQNKKVLLLYAVGSTVKSLRLSIIQDMEVLLPPKSEQDEIVSIIDEFDKRKYAENKKKTRLLEIKKGLMQKLLTGQIRVEVN